MEQTIVMIDMPQLMREISFRKKISALGTYQSADEYLDAMIAITERDMAEDPSFPK